ncbi:dTMP kinase [Bacteriovorax sp. Seq25_V]|uniref:dTMP kinase n=1 Tax=Bacteriovorax sp. Seq25_V TaxID=1201288 RepID=UPI00038A289F|nr:dTMP kinase [Bacteriovorax sp. Seq25_V]EQC44197.1 dTMP kinase [Bacteriovorax sp. Seq25_V]
MKNIDPTLLNNFRSPAFPGSFFMSFEGIEGAGKSTQIVRIKEYLEDRNFNVIVLREPGGTSFGERLRQAILNSEKDLHPTTEAYLFCSARAQLLTEVVLQELNEPNTIIICDRFLDSTIAYQGVARGLGIESVLKMHTIFPLNLVPHKTFYIRIDLETSLERQRMRNLPKDYFESRDDSFHSKLIEGYDACAELFTDRIKVIDGSKSADEVYLKLKSEIDELIFN